METDDLWVWLCKSQDLLERNAAIPFEVQYAGRFIRAFANEPHGAKLMIELPIQEGISVSPQVPDVEII